MAKSPPQSDSSKNKNDDSWGKLATDLLGIQFSDSEDDFDFPEDRSSQIAPRVAEHELLMDVTASAGGRPFEPDLSFPDDDIPEMATEPEIDLDSSNHRDDSKKDIWDMLDDWNWEEPVKPVARTTSVGPKELSSNRQSGREIGRGKSERKSESGSTDDRKDERTQAPGINTKATVSRGRDRRAEKPPSQAELRTGSQQPGRAAVERTEQNRLNQATITPSLKNDSEGGAFADGLGGEAHKNQSKSSTTRTIPTREATPLAKGSVADDVANEDDFAGNLFEQSSGSFDAEAAESGSDSDDTKHRRPRRRRRRGGRGRRSGAGETIDSNEDDTPPASTDSEDLFTTTANDDSGEGCEPDQPVDSSTTCGIEEEIRPSRSRHRRQNSAAPERPKSISRESFKNVEPLLEDDLQESSRLIDEEPLAPVNYEGIPTWETAISYLVRTHSPDPRGRGNSASRGRGGPSQRR
jgi:hypothetical protein